MRQPFFIAAILILLAVVFHHAASAPIALVDTWSHWKYGQWIWEQKRLPEREPLDPAFTDQSKPFVDSAWLGEVVGYLIFALGGAQGISLAAGLADVLKTLLLFIAYRRVSGSPGLALLGAALVQAGLWTSLGMFRPQVLGELCGAVVLFLAFAASPQRKQGNDARPSLLAACCLLPAVFVLWANLDASFLVGLIFLAVLLVGRVLDGRSDAGVGRLALATGLSAAATCLNPYGPRLFGAAVSGAQVHLQAAVDWQPLVSPRIAQLSYAAGAFAVSVMLTLLTLRLSPRRFSPADLLLVLVFGVAAWFIGRLMPWWLMVCGWVLLPHWTEIVERWVKSVGWVESSRPTDQPKTPGKPVSLEDSTHPTESTSPATRGRLLASGIALIIAAFLAIDAVRLAGRKQQGTPIELAEHLREAANRRTARVFAPLYWNDYLLWRLPATGQVFLFSRIEVFRPEQRDRYNRILTMRTGTDDWRTLLYRAEIDVVALSVNGPGKELFAHFLLNQEPGWQLAYVNEEATELIAVRDR
jgi:hypothetical protein